MQRDPVIFIVDDDPAARNSLAALVKSRRLAVETFGSAEEFLEKYDPAKRGCLIADVRMTGMSGATPNQPKKHRKNETHVTWNARMAGVLKLNRSMRLAFMSLRCGRRRAGTRFG